MGASGVDVGGTLYNVEFLDGTCVDLYNGCDEASDFTFTTQAEARQANQALLDQVFLYGVLGDFDSNSGLTAHCGGSSTCKVLTRYVVRFEFQDLSYQVYGKFLNNGTGVNGNVDEAFFPGNNFIHVQFLVFLDF